MLLTQLFWLGLLLPGYVVVRLVDREDIESGLPGMIGLSFVGSLALLTPVSIACYVIGLPVWVFAVACAGLVVAGGVELTRRGWWGDIGRMAVSAIGLQALIVLVDVVLAARTGSFTTGDATVHMARIRFLLDHGFSNLDPFCREPYFYPIYHTNLHHALQAAASLLTGQHLLTVWMGSLVWAKLLIVSGTFFLGRTIFHRTWIAWCCALCALGMTAHVPFLVYPNQVVPRGLFPFLLAFAARACRNEAGGRSVAKTAAVALIIGQFHGLYALFAAFTVAPLLLGVATWRMARRRPCRLVPLAAGIAIMSSLVFPGVSYLGSRHAAPVASPSPAADTSAVAGEAGAPPKIESTDRPRRRTAYFLPLDGGRQVVNTRSGFWSRRIRPVLLVICAIAAVTTLRRRDALIPIGAAVVTALWLFVPALCTFAIDQLGQSWVLLRSQFIFHLTWAVLVPGTVTAGFAALTRRIGRVDAPKGDDADGTVKRRRIGLAGTAAAAAGALSFAAGVEYGRTWPELRQHVAHATAPSDQRRRPYVRHMEQEAAIREIIPAGETVLCDVTVSALIVALHDVHVVASRSSSNGVPDLSRRLRDQRTMLAPGTPWAERRALLDAYGIRFVIVHHTDLDAGWTAPLLVNGVMYRGQPFVVEIDTGR